MKDMKEGLGSTRKPDTTHVRHAFKVYTARPCEYGSAKYERGNYLRPATPVEGSAPAAADFVRFRSYLRAAVDHFEKTLDAMENHLAGDPNLLDEAGMRRAAYAVDTDATPGAKIGASLLPHVAHGCASAMMAVTQAARYGLLPADPGTPWTDGVLDGWAEESFAFEPARMQSLGPLITEARMGDDYTPPPVIHDMVAGKCPDEPHTHSWNALGKEPR
jgi:hypothetical protein